MIPSVSKTALVHGASPRSAYVRIRVSADPHMGGDPDAAARVSDDHADMFEMILLATDGSSGPDAVLAYAQRLAGHYGSGVLVVCIGATSSVSRSIRRQVTQLRIDGVPARLAVVADGRDTASVIVRLATAWNADLLLVGSEGIGARSGLAQRLLESSPCPVLACRTPMTLV
jgi:nucleotide-binding universal stress UspA family protein